MFRLRDRRTSLHAQLGQERCSFPPVVARARMLARLQAVAAGENTGISLDRSVTDLSQRDFVVRVGIAAHAPAIIEDPVADPFRTGVPRGAQTKHTVHWRLIERVLPRAHASPRRNVMETLSANSATETDVVIVGAGPVGLT